MWKLLLHPIKHNIDKLQYLLAMASMEPSKMVHLQHIPDDQWNEICHHASAFVFSTMVWCMLNLTAGVRQGSSDVLDEEPVRFSINSNLQCKS